jgi:hypothetical protein
LYLILKVVVILTTATTVIAAEQDQTEPQHERPITRLNFGMFFQPIKPIHLVTAEWTHSYVIRLPNIVAPVKVGNSMDLETRRMHHCLNTTDRELCLELIPMLVHVQSLYETTIRKYNKMMSNIYKMLPNSEFLEGSKKRSGWFPFISKILHTVTGVACQDDLDRLKHVVKQLSETRGQHFQIFEKMTDRFQTISGVTNKRISNIVKIQRLQQHGTRSLFVKLHARDEQATNVMKTLRVITEILTETIGIENDVTCFNRKRFETKYFANR